MHRTTILASVLLLLAACGGRDTKDTRSAADRGRDLYAQGELKAALPLLLDAHKQQPDNPELCFFIGNIYSHERHPAEALRFYDLGIKNSAAPARFHFNIGLTRMQLGKYNAALHSLTLALTLDPKLADAHLDMGLAYYRLQELKKAAREWRLYLQKNRTPPSGRRSSRRSQYWKTKPTDSYSARPFLRPA
jgi:tetratricopeptide (TPR) repeat protein